MKKAYLLIFIFEISSLIFNFYAFGQTQNAAVSVTVQPKTSDFQFSFASTDALTNVNQDMTLSYQITYGANASANFSTNNTLVVDFSDDLAPNSSHVLDYVVGSAGNAYGGAVPVVDLSNRTITWNISNLPAGANNQTVNFQLRTNSNYTGASPVNFTTRAQMSNQYVTMPDQTINQTYQFDSSLVPSSPSPTPAPNSGGGSSSAPTPTPISVPRSTPIPTKSIAPGITPSIAPSPNILRIIGVDFTNISGNQATILISTSTPTKELVVYGTSPTALNQNAGTDNYSLSSSITLANLTPDTNYYFRVTSTDKTGRIIKSEIFTFKTAKNSTPLFLETGALTIQSNGNIIYSRIIDKNSISGFVILTNDTDYALSYVLKQLGDNNKFDVIVKDSSGKIATVRLSKKDPLLYMSALNTKTPGQYELFIREQDSNGNLIEKKAVNLKVIPHLSVYEKSTSKPIGDARVFLYYLNFKTNKYEQVAKEIFGNIKNPGFTDRFGILDLQLPAGRYRAETSAFGYDRAETKFVIGPGHEEQFPKIFLTKDPLNPVSILQNIKDWLADFFANISMLIHSFSDSIRFFNIISVVTVSSFVGMSLLSFKHKTYLDFKNMPVFFMFHVHHGLDKYTDKYIFGIIVDKDNLPITRAIVELVDSDTGNVLTHTTSNKKGHFHLQNNSGKNHCKLLIGKDGYKSTEVILGEEKMDKDGLKIVLVSGDKKWNGGFSGIKLIEHIGGNLFETTLILSLILELLFIGNFGIVRSLPFIILSILNIVLWYFYSNSKV